MDQTEIRVVTRGNNQSSTIGGPKLNSEQKHQSNSSSISPIILFGASCLLISTKSTPFHRGNNYSIGPDNTSLLLVNCRVPVPDGNLFNSALSWTRVSMQFDGFRSKLRHLLWFCGPRRLGKFLIICD